MYTYALTHWAVWFLFINNLNKSFPLAEVRCTLNYKTYILTNTFKQTKSKKKSVHAAAEIAIFNLAPGNFNGFKLKIWQQGRKHRRTTLRVYIQTRISDTHVHVRVWFPSFFCEVQFEDCLCYLSNTFRFY